MITAGYGSLKAAVLVRIMITIGLGSHPRASGVISVQSARELLEQVRQARRESAGVWHPPHGPPRAKRYPRKFAHVQILKDLFVYMI